MGSAPSANESGVKFDIWNIVTRFGKSHRQEKEKANVNRSRSLGAILGKEVNA
jgi:hypothetical protein